MARCGGVPIWPLAGHAQPAERMRRVCVLMPFPENDSDTQALVRAFVRALERFGWVEGKNIHVDYRFAAGDPTLFKTYAAELVSLSPDAILASTPPAVAALRQPNAHDTHRFRIRGSTPSGWALSRTSPDLAATSLGSAPPTRR